jgi:hypothetical protein
MCSPQARGLFLVKEKKSPPRNAPLAGKLALFSPFFVAYCGTHQKIWHPRIL